MKTLKEKELEPFFNPKSVCVAGASKSGWKLGNVVISNMLRFGYGGKIFPLHPDGGELMGFRAYPSSLEIDENVDLAIAVIPRDTVPSFVKECGEAGIRNIVVCAAGFSDCGAVGAKLESEILRSARKYGIRILGPNSVGTINTHGKFATSLLTLDVLEKGNVSIAAQTGLFQAGYERMFASLENPGISKVISLGNKADIDEIDALKYFENDSTTHVIGIYTEGVKDGRHFINVAKRISRRKPLVVLKGGRSSAGASSAFGHTGSLSGPQEIFSGALKQVSIIPANSINELIWGIKALSLCPPARGQGVGVVSITGAGCVLSADCLTEAGLCIPELSLKTLERIERITPSYFKVSNPADIWAAVETGGIGEAFRIFLDAFASQDNIDILIAITTLVPESTFEAEEVFGELKSSCQNKPLIATVLGAKPEEYWQWSKPLERIGIPVYDSIEGAVYAAKSLSLAGNPIREKRESPAYVKTEG